MEKDLEIVYKYSLDYLAKIGRLPINSTIDKNDLHRQLDHPLQEDGISSALVVEQLINDAEKGIVHSASGRFFGWVMGGNVHSSLAAEWLTSIWDQNAALYVSSPASAIVEEIAGKWLKGLLNIPQECSFAFTTGCQMAHFTCLAAARNSMLERMGWDSEKSGLFGAPAIKILTSRLLHGSTLRAIRFLGLGTDSISYLETDKDGKLSPEALTDALKVNHQSAIVILQAGDLNTGTFDDFDKTITIAHEYGAWVHIDGAFGLWATVSKNYRHLLKGCENADSWATDGHKWLNVPYDSGYAFIRNVSAHYKALSIRASYLTHSEDARDQMDWTPEWSRRARGFATYAAIRELGEKGIGQIVDKSCHLCTILIEELSKIDGVEVVSKPIINQALVRFIPPGNCSTLEEIDTFTDLVIQENLRKGTSFFGGTDWNGMRCMRISVCNWRTNAEDIAQTVQTFREILSGHY
jgi:glutamate/tyrosine decarboxylase-like PLP-dependent enzyme